MSQLTIMLLVVLAGTALFCAAGLSKVNYEKENADAPKISYLIHIAIFLMWSVFWVVVVYLFPLLSMGLGWLVLFSGLLPIGKKKASLLKSIIDNCFLSAITFGVVTFVYVHAI